MKPICLPALVFSFFLSFSCFAQYDCNDPSAWNYFPEAESDEDCVYFDECANGPELFAFAIMAQETYIGTEIVVSSMDYQDTLATHVFSDSGLLESSNMVMNLFDVCMEVDECYNVDLYMPFEADDFDGLLSLDTAFFQPLNYFDPLLISPGHFRVIVGPEQSLCGILGCTDPMALNYNPDATIDFGCSYCEGEGVIVYPEFYWGYSLPFRIWREDSLLVSGNFSSNFGLDQYMTCLDTGCYEFEIHGDAWQYDRIHLTNLEGDTLTSMTLTEYGQAIFPFSIGVEDCADSTAVYGCTNPAALNYDFYANIDDGSCDLQNDECGLTLEVVYDSLNNQIVVETDYFATDYPVYISWDMGDGTPLFETLEYFYHVYDSSNVTTVCATLYSFMFFENAPLCYTEECITIDPSEYGFTDGFPLFITDSALTSINEAKLEEAILYPNPASSNVSIKGISGVIETLNVFSLDGSMVESISPRKEDYIDLDVSQLAPGVYLIYIQTDHAQYAGRLVVQ